LVFNTRLPWQPFTELASLAMGNNSIRLRIDRRSISHALNVASRLNLASHKH
jgi:hypothetical protein